MIRSNAVIPTDKASRYLQQLCKHFAHKVPVDFTAERGTITLSGGTCALEAGAESLTISAQSTDDEALDRLQDVIVRHLERFAFREPPEITWVRR